MNDLVSIITPSYNTACYISDTIQSVLAQTYTNWEMIIVDDCSTDNTDTIVNPFLVDKRIRYLKNDKNRGAAFSRNRALCEAKGKWVAFLDSDDLWDKQKLERQIAFMTNHGYHFSYTRYREIDESGEYLGIEWTGPKRVTTLRLYLFNYIGCLTAMYDRDKIGLLQVAELKKRNDYALWIKAVRHCPAYLLDDTLASYRIRKEGSIMDRKQGRFKRIKYNYYLWRLGENRNPVSSLLLTTLNICFGLLKKVLYKRPRAV